MNPQFYDVSLPDCALPCRDNECLVLPDYRSLCMEISRNGAYSDIVTVYAISSIIGKPIQLYYSPVVSTFHASPFTCIVRGRQLVTTEHADVVIMWSCGDVIPEAGPVTINHFVPLQARPVNVVCAVPVNSDSDDDEQTGPTKAAVVESAQVSVSTPFDDATQDEALTDSDNDDGPPAKRLRGSQFLPVHEVVRLLSTNEDILPSVPRGYTSEIRTFS